MAELFDTSPQKVTAALESMPEQGSADFILPLLKTYLAWEGDADIRQRIVTILYELKTAAAIPELLKALRMPEFAHEQAFILSIFWNAGIIPVELGELVRVAVKGDYMTAFEALTVIEQMEDNADAGMAQDAVYDIEEHLDENPDAENVEILQQMRMLLIQYANL